MNNFTINLENVTRWYGDVVAINDISLTIKPGITGLLGPNGAGKTTLLNIMAGLLPPSSGTAHVGTFNSWGNQVELYKVAGLVPEREFIYPFLTGYQFVLLNAKLHKLPEPTKSADIAISLVGMEDSQGRKIETYSKGMKQRLKIAAAMVQDPQIIFLDEPFNGTDPTQRAKIANLLKSMADSGKTIVYSSHILGEVERIADEVAVIVNGRLAASGDHTEIRRLMTNRPHKFQISSSHDRRLAQILIGNNIVTALEFIDDKLHVMTSQLNEFAKITPKLAQENEISLFEVIPTDESLESVFSYLVDQ